LSLLWWLLLPNGFVLVVGFLLLAVSPISISSSTETDELTLLFVGLAVMVALRLSRGIASRPSGVIRPIHLPRISPLIPPPGVR
jgi:hypothetical protein